MEFTLGFLLPFLLMMTPIIYLFVFGLKRLRKGEGLHVLIHGAISILIGVVAPIIAAYASIFTLTVLNHNSETVECFTFVTGFIGIGIVIEVLVLPFISMLFWILDRNGNWRISNS